MYAIGTRGWTGIAQAATVKSDQEVDRLNGPVDRARGALDNLVQDYRYHVERVAELTVKLRETTRERDEASGRAGQWDLDRHTEQRRADRLQHEVTMVRAEMERNLAKLLATREELEAAKADVERLADERDRALAEVNRRFTSAQVGDYQTSEANLVAQPLRAQIRRLHEELVKERDANVTLRAKLLKVSERVWSPEVEDALSRTMTASAATLRDAITDVRRLLDASPSSPES